MQFSKTDFKAEFTKIIADYQDPLIPVKDILKTYNLSGTQLYLILDHFNIDRRVSKRDHKRSITYDQALTGLVEKLKTNTLCKLVKCSPSIASKAKQIVKLCNT